MSTELNRPFSPHLLLGCVCSSLFPTLFGLRVAGYIPPPGSDFTGGVLAAICVVACLTGIGLGYRYTARDSVLSFLAVTLGASSLLLIGFFAFIAFALQGFGPS